jgi:propionyl-CoA carboxylase beta chain
VLFRKQIDSAADPAAERARIVEDYRKRFLNPYAAAAADYLDDVIEPRETRYKIITALQALRDKFVPSLPRKHGNSPV